MQGGVAEFQFFWLGINTITSPFLEAFGPRQYPCERCKKVVRRQGNERWIIGDNRHGRYNLANTNTTEARTNGPHFNWTFARELAQEHFQVVHRFADDEKHNDVRNEKGAAAIFICGEWKSPYVAQTDRCLNAWHQKLRLIRPRGTIIAWIDWRRCCSIFYVARFFIQFRITFYWWISCILKQNKNCAYNVAVVVLLSNLSLFCLSLNSQTTFIESNPCTSARYCFN